MFNPAMAWPTAQLKAIKPPASIHQFTMMTSLSRSAAELGNIAQAEAGRRASLRSVLEFDKSGIDPAAAMRFHSGFRQIVVAQQNQCALAVGFEQELHYRLPRLETFHATPGERHFPVRNDLDVRSLDGNARRARDAKHPARPGIGVH